MGAVASRLGITTAQAYTVATGVVLAVVLGAVGLPPVWRGVPETAAAQLSLPIEPVEVVTEPRAPTPHLPPAVTPAPPPPRAGSLPLLPLEVPPAADVVESPPTTQAPPEPHTVSSFADFEHAGVPGAIDVAPDGTAYVVSDDAADGGSWIVALNADGDVVDSWQVQGQSPNRSRGLSGVAVDGDAVVVADASRSRLLFLDPTTGKIDLGPTIPDVPACILGVVPAPCEPGLLSQPPAITGVDVAPGGGYYVSDRAQGIVWRVSDSHVSIFASFDDRLPGEGPTGVSVDRYGDLIVPVSARLIALPLGAPALYVVRVINGYASAPRLELELGDRQVPADLVVGDSGRVYFTLASRNQVIDVGLDAGDRLTVAPGDTPFDRPSAITMIDGSLLVVDRGPAESRGRWTIHAISVLDRAADQDR